MDRINGAGHVNRQFVTEDLATNRPPTEITAEWLNSIQNEICAVIAAAGISLDGANSSQLLAALRAAGVFQTPAQFDSSTRAATTAFVQRAIGNFSGLFGYVASATLPATACGALVTFYGEVAGQVLTLPKVSTLTGNAQAITFRNLVAYPVMIAAAAGDVLNLIGNAAVTSMVLPAGHSLVVTNQGSATVWTIISGTASVKDLLDAKAPLASPVLTGVPSAPTASAGTENTQIANTAFVQQALGNYSWVTSYSTSGTTIAASDMGKVLTMSMPSGGVLWLPDVTTLKSGRTVTLFNWGDYPITIGTQNGQLINNNNGNYTTFKLAAKSTVELVGDGYSWMVINGSAQLTTSPLFASFQVANGFQKLPSGLILQWGYLNVPANSTITGTYPLAFTTGAFSFVCSHGIGGAWQNYTDWNHLGGGGSISLTQFQISSNDDTDTVYLWMAIGN